MVCKFNVDANIGRMGIDSKFLESLDDLSGRVVVVTGGTSGLGQQTAIYLAALGASVYACAPDTAECREGLGKVLDSLYTLPNDDRTKGTVTFHPLDLSEIQDTIDSANELRQKLVKDGHRGIDILVCNAGILGPPLRKLSKDGYEKTFAVNCLGHFTWMNCLLDLVKVAADKTKDSRIIFVSSEGYKSASKINYSTLQACPPGDKEGFFDAIPMLQHYFTSKLAIIYMAMELNRRLLSQGIDHIFANVVHPGRAGQTGIAEIGNRLMGPQALRWMKAIFSFGYMFNHSLEDAAKTQIFMSASKSVREKNIHGEYWVISTAWWPTFGHWMTYQGSAKEDLTLLGADKEEWRKLWDFCGRAVKIATDSSFSSLALDTDSSM